MIFYFIIGGFFIAMGLAIHVFKWYFLISGYNTMSKEKKANVDTKTLGRMMGIYCYFNGSLSIAAGLFYVLGFKSFITPAIILFCISTVYLLIKAQKCDGNMYVNGKLVKGAGIQIAVLAGVIVLILIFVSVILFISSQDTKVTFLEEGLQISGMYGEIYDWASIEEVSLTDSLPVLEMRTNGSALGSHLKGYFKSTEYGIIKLFVDTKISSYIFFKSKGTRSVPNGQIIIFNMADPEETKKIYDEIVLKIG